MSSIDTEEFLSDNVGLIKGIANKYWFETSKFSYDDLVAVGYQAAIHALHSFDESKGNKAITYVYKALDRHIREFVRKNKHDLYLSNYMQKKHWEETKGLSEKEAEEMRGLGSPMAIRIDASKNDDMHVSQILPSGSPPPEEQMMVEEQRDILLEEINRLPSNQRTVVKGHYLNGETFDELGQQLGLSKQRTQQIEQIAFKTLKGRLSSRLGDFIARPDGLARRAK
jgi:RNA polymerase sigma factor (sigma-70 family)